MGVAFWILPRFSHGPARGRESLGSVALALLNFGVLAAGLTVALGLPASVRLVGRAAAVLAAAAFALNAWRRVKPTELTPRA